MSKDAPILQEVMSCEHRHNQASGVWMEDIEQVAFKQFEKGTHNFSKGFSRFQPFGQILPSRFADFEKQIHAMNAQKDDIWVCSFPKSGTTWTQEMIWNIVHDLDIEKAKKTELDIRVPYVELSAILPTSVDYSLLCSLFADETEEEGKLSYATSFDRVDSMSSPRVLKTHLSFDMLPPTVMKNNSKLIYITRNPRDVCVSYYNHWKNMNDFDGSWDTFFDAFIGDVCPYYSPFIEHVLGYWQQKENKNVLFITYEEMKKDLPGVILKAATFLKKPISAKGVETLAEHLSFKNMKKNNMVNKKRRLSKSSTAGEFIRKGETGDWRNYMNKDQIERIRHWEEEKLKGSDFHFIYDV